ncbi:LacI family DNA-binding transcriptional regulator [Sorangium sp. So ce726]|uniref:LacI family DNA-binding transcriptional regulator n=1 Tax=Sorangium sp. So ce726 TaxID=3133319 RepID=UPI003F5DA0D3
MSPPFTIQPGPRPQIRIEEVAKRARVSPATVSRVVNGRGKYSAETRERVLAVIDELGYVPNTAARSLAQGKTGVLGLLLPNISTEFISSLVRAIAASAAEAGYDVLLSLRPEAPARRLVGRHNTDGVLIFGHYVHEADLQQLVHQKCPAVLMYQSSPADVPLPSVIIKNASGARAIVGHVIEAHGRRRIAFLHGVSESEDSTTRAEGYREALAEHGIAVDPRLMRRGFDAREARAATLAWVREGVDFDAIFAWCDHAAAGAMEALRAAGKRVPVDVSVVGFDDAPSARHLEPALTTVRAPTDGVGYRAVQALVDLIQTGKAERRIELPTELIVRRSCGCDL